jgi:hypothetical protein
VEQDLDDELRDYVDTGGGAAPGTSPERSIKH